MHIQILGAAGMLGQKLTRAITGGALAYDRLMLADVVTPPPVEGATGLALNLTDPDPQTEGGAGEPLAPTTSR